MPSFSTALTGLESNNTALNTIANNLANMSTVGYKDQTDQFSTLFYQQLSSGANGSVQVGVGTQIAQTETDFTEGGVSGTSQSTDMALQGNGFFVVDDHGTQELTRAGDFVLNSGRSIADDERCFRDGLSGDQRKRYRLRRGCSRSYYRWGKHWRPNRLDRSTFKPIWTLRPQSERPCPHPSRSMTRWDLPIKLR